MVDNKLIVKLFKKPPLDCRRNTKRGVKSNIMAISRKAGCSTGWVYKQLMKAGLWPVKKGK